MNRFQPRFLGQNWHISRRDQNGLWDAFSAAIMRFVGFQNTATRLRWLLITIVALAALPVFGLYLLRLNASSDAALIEARELAVSLASRGAETQDNLIASAQTLVETISLLPEVRNRGAGCDSILARLNEHTAWASSIFLLDRGGRGVCSSMAGARGVDFSDRQYFKDAVATRKSVVGEPIIGRVTRIPVVAVAFPMVEQNGGIGGVLVLGIELSWIRTISAVARTKHDGAVLAINHDGALISRHQRNAEIGGVVEAKNGTGQMLRRLANAPGPYILLEDGDVERIFGIARTKDGKLTIAVGFDRAAVLEPIRQRFWSDLFWLLTVALGSVLLALTIAEFSVLRGVRKLNNTALRLKAGKMGVRVQLAPHVATELHELAASFNSMIAEFERLAYLDRLTGLPNRRYLERQLLRGERDADGVPMPEALLAIDLDGFKPVNDIHGHAMGDRVLAAVARRIAGVVDGRATVARLGGDEFVAVMQLKPHGDLREQGRAFGEEIREALRSPFEIDGITFLVGASIGLAVVPEDAETLAGALVAADAALYEAKRLGRNRVIDQSPSLAASGDEATVLEGYWTSLELIGLDNYNS